MTRTAFKGSLSLSLLLALCRPSPPRQFRSLSFVFLFFLPFLVSLMLLYPRPFLFRRFNNPANGGIPAAWVPVFAGTDDIFQVRDRSYKFVFNTDANATPPGVPSGPRGPSARPGGAREWPRIMILLRSRLRLTAIKTLVIAVANYVIT